MPTGDWYTDPELWKAVIGAVGGYATSQAAAKGQKVRFMQRPETPEEKAYRVYAEGLAGMHGTPGPTYSYLAPQIDAQLQRLSASSSAYHGLDRLDPVTGQPVQAPALTRQTGGLDFSTLPKPWEQALASIGTQGGIGGRLPAAAAGLAAGGGDYGAGAPGNIRNQVNWADNPPMDTYAGSGLPKETDPQRNAALGMPWNNLDASGLPAGMSRADMGALAVFGRQYGKGALEVVGGILLHNPGLGVKGAIDLYHASKTPPAGTTPPTTVGMP